MKIAINTCYGGFSLSPKAEYEVLKRMGYANIKYLNSDKVEVPLDSTEWSCNFYSNEEYVSMSRTDDRTNLHLIAVIEEMGEEADGDYAQLEIIEIPDDVDWYIDYYDGIETVREKHRSWG